MSLDLYTEYVKERGDVEVIPDPEGRGFVAIKCYQDRGEIYIVDLFVKKEARGGNTYPLLVDEIIRQHPWASFLTGSIHLDSNATAQQTLLSALKSGWEVVRAEQNMLTILRKVRK